MTEDDNSIEYEETTETFEDGTTRTPKTSNSKDAELSEDLPKTMAAAGDPDDIDRQANHYVAAPDSTSRRVKTPTRESSQEEDED